MYLDPKTIRIMPDIQRNNLISFNCISIIQNKKKNRYTDFESCISCRISMENLSEKELETLALEISRSNRTAFDRLFRYFYTQLVHFAFRFTRDKDAACDIVQEAFVSLWNNRETLDPDQSLQAFIYKIVRNRALNYQRDYSSRIVILNDSAEDLKTETEHSNSSEHLKDKFKEWINELPDRQREAFELSRYDGLDHEEIAGVMSVSVKTVNNHIVEALRKLRNNYDTYKNEIKRKKP